MSWAFRSFWGLVVGVAAVGAAAASGGEDASRLGERLFVTKVRPLLAAKCLACHGNDPVEIKGGLDLRARSSAMAGGQSGQQAILPGDAEQSLLYQAVRWEGLEMPPKENDRLSAEEIEAVRQWIAAGAPWPEPSERSAAASDFWSAEGGVQIATSGGLSDEWTSRRYEPESVWAYQPIQRPAVPEPAIDAKRVQNAIDAFIQAQLAQAGVKRLAEPADRRTFIRRVTFDLHGLPPSPAEVAEFLADKEPGARARLIKRLLASPRYGEQQARHWLDVVRYADTGGFSNDIERPNTWRYRDYVVRSFNRDKPYDRFITEQLAGDELDADDPELLIAAGFLRAGPWEHTAMTVAAMTRQQFLDDVTHHVGVALLGQGLRCASCHDHKFDPVPTRDYYRVQAVFAPVQFAERRAEFLPDENVKDFASLRKRVEERIARLQILRQPLQQKSEAAKAAYLRKHGVERVADLPAAARPAGGNFGREFGLDRREQSLVKVYEKTFDYLKRELERFEPRAMSVYSGTDNGYLSLKPVYRVPPRRLGATRAGRSGLAPAVHILAGGALESPLEPVTPGVLSAMTGANERLERTAWNTIPESVDGRRLALAQWIASPNNTLTARVIVNRVWQQHFGRGIVATPNNFGVMGARPTHPELLDWLTTWFVEHDWSLKRLHELILASATYQQASEHPDRAQLDEIDSTNSLLAYFPTRRLAAEEIRDAALMASGELNLDMGGPGVFPEINWEVALQPRHIMGSVAPAYVPSRTPEERNRRTLYVFRYRTLADPFLEVFNQPVSETSCERREETTVTPQVFALFNSEFIQARSLAFAAALTRASGKRNEMLETAFLRAYGRPPTMEELGICTAHYERMLAHHRQQEPPPVPLPKRIERAMIEEFTGEMVRWEEELPLVDYERDTTAWEVGPDVRALAEVCLVLLNSNEFLYVR